jgi:signal peptide peptidase SppA
MASNTTHTSGNHTRPSDPSWTWPFRYPRRVVDDDHGAASDEEHSSDDDDTLATTVESQRQQLRQRLWGKRQSTTKSLRNQTSDNNNANDNHTIRTKHITNNNRTDDTDKGVEQKRRTKDSNRWNVTTTADDNRSSVEIEYTELEGTVAADATNGTDSAPIKPSRYRFIFQRQQQPSNCSLPENREKPADQTEGTQLGKTSESEATDRTLESRGAKTDTSGTSNPSLDTNEYSNSHHSEPNSKVNTKEPTKAPRSFFRLSLPRPSDDSATPKKKSLSQETATEHDTNTGTSQVDNSINEAFEDDTGDQRDEIEITVLTLEPDTETDLKNKSADEKNGMEQRPTTPTPVKANETSTEDESSLSTKNATASVEGSETMGNGTESQHTTTSPEAQTTPQTTTVPPPGMQSPAMILMGPGMGSSPHPYRYSLNRGTQPVGVGRQRGASQPVSPNSLILAEIFVSVLGTAMRLWFLTWITRRLATQEESIQPTQHFVWERLNDRYTRDNDALKTVIQKPPKGVSLAKWRRKHVRNQGKYKPARADLENTFSRTVIVVDVHSSSNGSVDVEFLADVVSFLLQQHRGHAFGTDKETGLARDLEVILSVNSPGGSVASYGLASAQIERLANVVGITTTACVDRYAASGGYMIASQAHRIVAAPFASVGSVGVIMEGLNFHDLAKRYGVQPMILKAGNEKNPLTTFGSVSKQDLKHETERLEKVHDAFRQLVVRGRPELADKLDEVANGNVFLGLEAVELGLVDVVMTSDDYIMERVRAGERVLKLHRSQQTNFSRRFNLSPLDILPHLKTWLSEKVVSGAHAERNVARLLQLVSAVSVAKHIVSEFFKTGNTDI